MNYKQNYIFPGRRVVVASGEMKVGSCWDHATKIGKCLEEFGILGECAEIVACYKEQGVPEKCFISCEERQTS